MINTVYLTRNGLLEPLGQSQVMSYLRGLSKNYRIKLITYEKPEDLENSDLLALTRADCILHGIDWCPKSFRHSPKIFAPAWNMLEMFYLVYSAVKAGDAQIIHARSYLPAAVAWAVNRLTGTPFIFDMRALFPEELITAGRLHRNSIVYKVLIRIEKLCMRDAAIVVSLTDAAVGYLLKQYPTELEVKRIAVIPTCADLKRFKPLKKMPTKLVYGCVGTVLSGWFLLDWLAIFFNLISKENLEAKFEVVTRDDVEKVRAALDVDGKLGARLSIFSCTSEKVHQALQKQSTSVMFFTAGISKLGSAPTRLGEALGSGMPVVANEGVGDVADIIRKYNVGVIVKDKTGATMSQAINQLEVLRLDPDLRLRCRRAAEEVFSLEAGTEAYRSLYARILGTK